jgi:hypothetical protein
MLSDPSAHLHHPHHDPFDGPARFFAPQIETADKMEQVVHEKAHFQTGFVRREPAATGLIPSKAAINTHSSAYGKR